MKKIVIENGALCRQLTEQDRTKALAWSGTRYFLVDFPGHGDFIFELVCLEGDKFKWVALRNGVATNHITGGMYDCIRAAITEGGKVVAMEGKEVLETLGARILRGCE